MKWKRDGEAKDIVMGHINDEIHKWVSGGTVLDLGGSVGWFTSNVEADRVIVVDLDLDSLGDCCSESVYGSILKLPFADESFDHVVARGVLHHVPEMLGSALDEAMRVLKDGGTLFVHDPGGRNPPAVIARALFPTNIHDPDERPFDPRHLRKEVGMRFDVVDEHYHHLTGYLLPHVIPRTPKAIRPGMRNLAGMIVKAESRLMNDRKLLHRWAAYVQIVGRRPERRRVAKRKGGRK